ncbi:helix-turn-helix domain-containing protein [Pontibacter qinzhouensis]|uniref:Helix-turn-helix domain-containing protein n=1 Tax=Pontibacter qinzhouensis TaxID=2603253 RepID=A0A5C8K883_9BACT|nr:helix-turn-helix domain-containing protein [Pontibacter qinzhouensis]TXK46364.1 helix-turn-helix domain-containing protein [Pontibacter qinzhouensis]
MAETTLHIRNMVCPRCIKVVTDELTNLGLPVVEVKLGEAKLSAVPAPDALNKVRVVLLENGFELLEDKKSEVVEQIKVAIIQLVQSGRIEDLTTNISTYLESELGHDYNYLSSLFSAEENLTIARYVVLQKVERAKELLTYNELSLSQISFQLGYSSVAHLSNQFKQITGITPSDFKKSNASSRKPLDQVT